MGGCCCLLGLLFSFSNDRKRRAGFSVCAGQPVQESTNCEKSKKRRWMKMFTLGQRDKGPTTKGLARSADPSLSFGVASIAWPVYTESLAQQNHFTHSQTETVGHFSKAPQASSLSTSRSMDRFLIESHPSVSSGVVGRSSCSTWR